ncbi:putative glucan endo-1,3-beta-glucosidase A6 [Cinnamomum micranthum f. kanehirae]|uniref:glucan endo-1,3-beta-D-glucosidase n=1 Tax=Cinnamomum micranthum f. kanehirae TaxID=337451 RepID=A0A443P8M3_9MAGN|nr:putative glucan endo-1,3-beta-glucosidase A6 [Cinnamomum micranthum f. kanehirae]
MESSFTTSPNKASHLVLLLLCLSFISICNAEISSKLGVNYGQLGNNLPSPSHSIKLIESLKLGRVKLYDANPEILEPLSKTHLQVSIMVPNELIPNISSSQSASDTWVCSNLLPFYNKTRIRNLLVGNEILSDYSNKQLWYDLVPAMRRIKQSLTTHNIKNVKVGTTLAMDALQTTDPPSNATFRPDISDSVMKPLLKFVSETRSYYFVNVYTYFAWAANPNKTKLDYALLRRTGLTYTDPGSGLTYNNLLDQLLDSIYSAMGSIGYSDIRITIAETGWPSKGDFDQIGANIYNAAIYNRNLARKMATKPPLGTPARPGRVIPTFIFALYNENEKGGPGTERNWGLLYPNGSRVYEADLTGKKSDSSYGPLPNPTNNVPYRGRIWCVAGAGKVNATALGLALSYACGEGNGTCESIQRGRECYLPNDLVSHASYAFNSYWQQFRRVGGTCFFNGLAVQTTKDPSYGSCKFPSQYN